MAADPSWRGPDNREAARERLARNPFYVLGLRPDCGRADVEREGQKLIGMLELELSTANSYRSPIGVHRRTSELVRGAMAELRDPNRRLLHELWATLEPGGPEREAGDRDPDRDPDRNLDPNPDRERDEEDSTNLAPFAALRVLGFGRSRF